MRLTINEVNAEISKTQQASTPSETVILANQPPLQSQTNQNHPALFPNGITIGEEGRTDITFA